METPLQNNIENVDNRNGKHVCKFCGKKFDRKQTVSRHRLNNCHSNSESKISKKKLQKIVDCQKLYKCNDIITKNINLLSEPIEKQKIVINKHSLKTIYDPCSTKEQSSNNFVIDEKIEKLELEKKMFPKIDDHNKNQTINVETNSEILSVLAKMCESQQKLQNSLYESQQKMEKSLYESQQKMENSLYELQKTHDESISSLKKNCNKSNKTRPYKILII